MNIGPTGGGMVTTGVRWCVQRIRVVIWLATGAGEPWSTSSMTLGYYAFGKLASNCGQVNLDSKKKKKIPFKGKFPEESVSWLHLSRNSHLCIGNVSFNILNNLRGERVLRNHGLQSNMG